MIFEEGQNLNDRFLKARSSLVAMFPRDRRPGKTYQGFIKALPRLGPGAREAMKTHLREHHRRVAGKHGTQWG